HRLFSILFAPTGCEDRVHKERHQITPVPGTWPSPLHFTVLNTLSSASHRKARCSSTPNSSSRRVRSPPFTPMQTLARLGIPQVLNGLLMSEERSSTSRPLAASIRR